MNKNILFYPLIFILFVIIVITADPGYGVAPSLEKGSFITEVEGLAYFSEDKTLRQTRLEAEMDAKRKAVEGVGDQRALPEPGKTGIGGGGGSVSRFSSI
jgi:hypothetical protein